MNTKFPVVQSSVLACCSPPSPRGPCVRAEVVGGGGTPGPRARTGSGTGVAGTTGSRTGVAGTTGSRTGVAGTTGSGTGVAGTTGSRTGVAGTTGSATGAAGTAGNPTGAAGAPRRRRDAVVVQKLCATKVTLMNPVLVDFETYTGTVTAECSARLSAARLRGQPRLPGDAYAGPYAYPANPGTTADARPSRGTSAQQWAVSSMLAATRLGHGWRHVVEQMRERVGLQRNLVLGPGFGTAQRVRVQPHHGEHDAAVRREQCGRRDLHRHRGHVQAGREAEHPAHGGLDPGLRSCGRTSRPGCRARPRSSRTATTSAASGWSVPLQFMLDPTSMDAAGPYIPVPATITLNIDDIAFIP